MTVKVNISQTSDYGNGSPIVHVEGDNAAETANAYRNARRLVAKVEEEIKEEKTE